MPSIFNANAGPESNMTWADAIRRVAQTVGGAEQPLATAAARDALEEVLAEWNAEKPWKFLQVMTDPIAVTSTTTRYALPTRFAKAYDAYIEGMGKLEYLEAWIYDAHQPAPVRGAYTLYNVGTTGQIELLPGQTGNLVVRYHRLISTVGTDDDFLDIPESYVPALLAGARAMLTADRGDAVAAYWEAKYARRLVRIKSFDDMIPDQEITFVPLAMVHMAAGGGGNSSGGGGGSSLITLTQEDFSKMYIREQQSWITTRYAAPVDLVASWSGNVSSGGQRQTRGQIGFLRTATPAGPDRVVECVCDPGFATSSAHGDVWTGPLDTLDAGFWHREHWAWGYMSQLKADPVVNPSATMYSAFCVVSMVNATPPFNDPPAGNAQLQSLQIRARLSDGRWEIYQDNPDIGSQIDALTGVQPFTTGTPYSFLVMLHFKAGEYIDAYVSRVGEEPVLGAHLTGSQVILSPDAAWPNQSLGFYVTSGSLAGAKNAIMFTDFCDNIRNISG